VTADDAVGAVGDRRRDLRDGDPGRVRGQDGVSRGDVCEFPEEVAFQFQILRDGFEDEVGGRESTFPVERVLDAGGDVGRRAVGEALRPEEGDDLADPVGRVVEVLLSVVEQRDVVAVDGEVCGEPVAHVAGTDDADRSCLGHTLRSRRGVNSVVVVGDGRCRSLVGDSGRQDAAGRRSSSPGRSLPVSRPSRRHSPRLPRLPSVVRPSPRSRPVRGAVRR